MDQIRELALKMRESLEALSSAELPLALSKFPDGSCFDASVLLGAFLVDNGISGFELISADRWDAEERRSKSHAWLSRDGLIVDITSDQFPDGPGRVVVSKDSGWHRRFHAESFGAADFRELHDHGIDELHELYATLKPRLSA